ncbi:MAG: hypothetical protein IJX98_04370 [Clostridia bacterium]|nr:hypothetical protein [Clostridia bacterium]
MKRKIVLFFVLLSMLFPFFAGCSSGFYYNYDELIETVERAEIIYIPSDESEIDILVQLEEKEKVEVLQGLSRIRYDYIVFGDKPTPNGVCLRLFYSEGTSETLNWVSGMATCDPKEFERLISPYISD